MFSHYATREISPICKTSVFSILGATLRKKWVIKLIFCMQVRMKACYKLILWFRWGRSSISKVLKIASLQCLYNTSKKELKMKFVFCMLINIKVSYKLISTLWAPKFPTRWYYHYQWVWTRILKLLKVISLQYLYNISENISY